jgi:hypothetical protein
MLDVVQRDMQSTLKVSAVVLFGGSHIHYQGVVLEKVLEQLGF